VPVVEKEEEEIDVKAIGEKIKANCQPCLLAVKNCKVGWCAGEKQGE
jgi:hypothetical protein